MIIVKTSHAPYLAIPYEDLLLADSIANLKQGIGLMGMRFPGQPRKAQIVKGYAKYVKEHPKDILEKLNAESLMYMKNILDQGKGGSVTIQTPQHFTQLQQMELVVTREDVKTGTSELFMIDELHDTFSPHIADAYKNPSKTLENDMIKGLEDIARQLESADDKEAKAKELLLDAMMFQLGYDLNDIGNAHAKQLKQKLPAEMNDQELDAFEALLNDQSKCLSEHVQQLKDAAKDCPQLARTKDYAKNLKSLYQSAEDAKESIAHLLKMIDQMKRSKTDFDSVMAEILREFPEDDFFEEITFKVQLDQTPIYRTFKVIDRCSLFELNMLIQFCFDWHDMRPHAFKYQSMDGEWMVMSPTTRLSDLMLDEGEKLYYLYDSKGDKWEHTLTVEAVDDYEGNEDDYEPRCITGSGPDPGERSGGNAWAHRNFPYIVKNKKKYSPFSISIINDSFHLWWTIERKIWIQQGIIKYDD